MVGSVAAGLDTTIVNVALDDLGRYFGVSVATVQWVSTACMLALTAAVPVTAWSVSRFGWRQAWLASLSLFLIGSTLCGLSWSIGSLMAFRVIQGLGGGMLLPLIRTILAQAAGQDRLGRAMVFVAVPASLTPVLGPVLGGIVVKVLSWRWVFYLNVPICLVGLVLAVRVLPSSNRREPAVPLDLCGLLIFSTGLAAVVCGLSEAGNQNQFTAPTAWVPLALALPLLAGYGVRTLLSRSQPAIDLRLFRIRSFAASSIMLFLLSGSLFEAMFLLPLYYQQARHASALEAGLMLAPLGLGARIAMSYVGNSSTASVSSAC